MTGATGTWASDPGACGVGLGAVRHEVPVGSTPSTTVRKGRPATGRAPAGGGLPRSVSSTSRSRAFPPATRPRPAAVPPRDRPPLSGRTDLGAAPALHGSLGPVSARTTPVADKGLRSGSCHERKPMSVRAVMPQPVKTAGRACPSALVGDGGRSSTAVVHRGRRPAGRHDIAVPGLNLASLIHPRTTTRESTTSTSTTTRDFSWYQGHFPTVASLRRRSRSIPGEPMTFEASGYYMFHPCAAERMAPTCRTFASSRCSATPSSAPSRRTSTSRPGATRPRHSNAPSTWRTNGWPVRWSGWSPIPTTTAQPPSPGVRTPRPVRRAAQRLGTHFPAEQIHVFESESFFEQPEATYTGVLDFLGLPQVLPDRFDRWNGRPSRPCRRRRVPGCVITSASHDRALAAQLGRDPAWLS